MRCLFRWQRWVCELVPFFASVFCLCEFNFPVGPTLSRALPTSQFNIGKKLLELMQAINRTFDEREKANPDLAGRALGS
jgi:hypothetical protein